LCGALITFEEFTPRRRQRDHVIVLGNAFPKLQNETQVSRRDLFGRPGEPGIHMVIFEASGRLIAFVASQHLARRKACSPLKVLQRCNIYDV
jgi:hypothetical protein